MPEPRTAPRFLSWGELLWDCFAHGEYLGGASSNLAVHVGSLGFPSTLVCRVGDDDLGRRAVNELRRRGIDTRGVQIDSARATGRVKVSIRDGEPHYALRGDSAWSALVWNELTAELVRECQVFCYGSMPQSHPAGIESWRRAIAAAGHCLRVFDVNLRRYMPQAKELEQHLRAASVVKLNEQELVRLQEMLARKDLIDWLLSQTAVELVALTRGTAGCRLVTREEEVEHPGFAAQPGGDNVGAGDGFTAVLAAGVVHGAELSRIAQCANRYGAFVASCKGATPEIPAEILDETLALLLSTPPAQ